MHSTININLLFALAMCDYKIALFASKNVNIGPLSYQLSISFHLISIP
jgi:hypothetical protein